MIISRTPFRISFFGGGTDYPVWYRENPGAVLSTSINKYCYITLRYLPPFFEHRSRIVYGKIELVKDSSQIEHPAVRETLRFLNITEGIELHHDGDLPARSGLGSSSSFTVGLLHGLHALRGKMPTKMQLATEAIHVEQNLIRENVGSQDQVIAAFGGLRRIEFHNGDGIRAHPLTVEPGRVNELQESLTLFFTGLSRTASEIAGTQIRNTEGKKKELRTMYGLVEEAAKVLNNGAPLAEFGRLLHESWQIKRSLTDKISTSQIDEIYETARKAGAVGGKLLGAGGGGFMLFFAEPGARSRIQQALGRLLHVPFQFENQGSQIVFYEP